MSFLDCNHSPRSKKTNAERDEKHNNYYRNVCECVFRKAWNEKRLWLKYMEEENKIHCLTCHVSKKCVYSWDRQFKRDCRISQAFKKSSEDYEKVIGKKTNEAPAMKMIRGLNKNTSKLKHIFRTTTSDIAVQCRPISDYVSIIIIITTLFAT